LFFQVSDLLLNLRLVGMPCLELSDERNDRCCILRIDSLLQKTLVVAGGTGDSFPKLGRVYRGGHAVDLVVANIEHEFDELKVVPLGHLAPAIQITFPKLVGH
jgi:hypothetical protein